jgi:hypothetical protein
VTATPSISSATRRSDTRAGVPASNSFTEYIDSSVLNVSGGLGRFSGHPEILGEMFECAAYRERCHAAQCA